MTKFFKISLLTLTIAAWPPAAVAGTAAEIDAAVNETLDVFRRDVNGAEVFLNQAAGYLVFPRVIKVGVGIGGETGEGALRVGGKTVDYYRTSSGSIGLQLGAQSKSIVIAFMTKDVLKKFRES